MNNTKAVELIDDIDPRERDIQKGFVGCDILCKAKENPQTPEEYKAAHDHWKDHKYLAGCSHSN